MEEQGRIDARVSRAIGRFLPNENSWAINFEKGKGGGGMNEEGGGATSATSVSRPRLMHGSLISKFCSRRLLSTLV